MFYCGWECKHISNLQNVGHFLYYPHFFSLQDWGVCMRFFHFASLLVVKALPMLNTFSDRVRMSISPLCTKMWLYCWAWLIDWVCLTLLVINLVDPPEKEYVLLSICLADNSFPIPFTCEFPIASPGNKHNWLHCTSYRRIAPVE